jgi:hypothetical protein
VFARGREVPPEVVNVKESAGRVDRVEKSSNARRTTRRPSFLPRKWLTALTTLPRSESSSSSSSPPLFFFFLFYGCSSDIKGCRRNSKLFSSGSRHRRASSRLSIHSRACAGTSGFFFFFPSYFSSCLILDSKINSNYPRLPATGADASLARLRRDSLEVRRVAWPTVSNGFWIRVSLW